MIFCFHKWKYYFHKKYRKCFKCKVIEKRFFNGIEMEWEEIDYETFLIDFNNELKKEEKKEKILKKTIKERTKLGWMASTVSASLGVSLGY